MCAGYDYIVIFVLSNTRIMNLHFDFKEANGYKRGSQIARVTTEAWVAQNMYCPVCGAPMLKHYKNNMPVADFFCTNCKSDFELKSKQSNTGNIGKKIEDGAYDTMIERITSRHNPNLFVMVHDDCNVRNFLIIPNYFFVPDIIIKRPPLGPKARRAGWEGCKIDVENIPDSGKIYIIRNSKEEDKTKVIAQYQKSLGLKKNRIDSRGWLFAVLKCIEHIPNEYFTLKQVYDFADELHKKFPNNNTVKDKIRQQLQFLRDKGFIRFVSPGVYKKLH